MGYSLYGRATPMKRAEIGPAFLLSGNLPGTSTSVPSPSIPAGTVFFYSVIAIDSKGALSPW